MGQETSSTYGSPSPTSGVYPVYFTRGPLPQLSSPSSTRSSTTLSNASMTPRDGNTVATANENLTIAGPEYRQDSGSEDSNARSIPPPSKFKIYYATAETEKRDFDGWENKLCFPLPITDVGTCCTAEWIPCYLFGKSYWRLEQLRERKDPSNKSYKTGQGCNIWCWGWAGLQVFQCGWVGTGFQRNRVRATYGIKGTCFDDFLTAYFCNCCVLMQTDREIQAREGRIRFITNKNYDPREKLKQEASASQQPIPMQQMRYKPNEDTDDRIAAPNVISPIKKANADTKKSTPFPQQGVLPSHRNSKVGSAYRSAKSETPHRKTSDFTWSDFILFSKNKSPVTQSIHSPKDTSQSRSGMWSPKKVPGCSENEGESRNTKQHDQSIQREPQPSGTKSEKQQPIDREQELSRRSSDTMVNNWRHNSFKKSASRSNGKSKARKATKMSYVHDFTDSAINKAVLDYYDRQQHNVDENQKPKVQKAISSGDASKTTSPSATPASRLSNNATLIGSAAREISSKEMIAGNDASSEQYVLPSSKSKREITGNPIKDTSKNYNSHALDDCPKASEGPGEASYHQGPLEHSVDQCPRHLDGTSSDARERCRGISANYGEVTTRSSSSREENKAQLLNTGKGDGTSSSRVPESYKQLDDSSTDGSALTAAVVDDTETLHKTLTGRRPENTGEFSALNDSLIRSHKDNQLDLDKQHDLRQTLFAALPKAFGKDGGTPYSQSLHGSQKSQAQSSLERNIDESRLQQPQSFQESLPKSKLEHALGETRSNSVVTQDEEVHRKLPTNETKAANEKNGSPGLKT